ncbi:AT-hook motif nuclear-localized protein 6 [Arachis ipaensis]|uniref:AT-hook motif nuclear-localized protein 6 n=1 Tax=Arachis ipaensis TaxID=130454 RepID=UPI000A2B8EB4|nr:AT-hook motif nuclear-localized protein 6 [Arachis ipaensis]
MPSVNCSKVSHGIKVQELGKLIPYELTVNPGQDVAKEILEAWGASNRFGCILSASGSIARAVFGRPNSNEIRIYEGSFEILSMSGLYMLRDDGSEASSLSITLAASNGTAFAGTLINTLMANDTVQVRIFRVSLNLFFTCSQRL